MKMEVDPAVAKALYDRLLTPTKDRDGAVVYTVSITLASELRNVISESMKQE